jgi:hypothetical protein
MSDEYYSDSELVSHMERMLAFARLHRTPCTKLHGHSGTRTYQSWVNMVNRCYRPSSKSYPQYGGRGITVCDRWRYNFANFLADMGERPIGCTIGRKDHSGNYELANCKWSTKVEQTISRRDIKLTTFDVQKIRLLYQLGLYSRRELSRMYSVNECTITRVINHKRRKEA